MRQLETFAPGHPRMGNPIPFLCTATQNRMFLQASHFYSSSIVDPYSLNLKEHCKQLAASVSTVTAFNAFTIN